MGSCMKLRTLAVVIAAAGAAAAGGCSSALTASQLPAASGEPGGYWTQSRLLAATPWREPGYQPGPSASAPASAPGVRVGALFEHDASGDHFCTASVVASPGRDLLITAAHCLNGGQGGGYRQDIVFIPGYRDGQAPSGIWAPARLVVAPQWMNSSDPDFDVGFVVLKPQDGKNIEQVLGADQLGIDPGYQNQVRVTGYPASAHAPITCTGRTSQQSPSQLRFECDGFTGGTSGSPWVTDVDPQTGTGTIVGVIGGYQEGGSTAAISYSPYLGEQVEQLYHQAVADEPAQAG
jgi:V8-like Glu-specific endopeptidase